MHLWSNGGPFLLFIKFVLPHWCISFKDNPILFLKKKAKKEEIDITANTVHIPLIHMTHKFNILFTRQISFNFLKRISFNRVS